MRNMQQSRVTEWVQLCEQWCEPEWTQWCDGSPHEFAAHHLNDETPHGEGEPALLTPTEAITVIAQECRGIFRGRTMFVVPYLSEDNTAGVLVTDCPSCAAQQCRTAHVGVESPEDVSDDCVFTATLCFRSGTETAQQICCQMTGLASLDTQCRTNPARKRLNLPLQTLPTFRVAGENCLDCARLCPNRARAIASAAVKFPGA